MAGIDHYPQEDKTAMSKKKIVKRSKVKSFVRVYNYNHLMPMRCPVDILLDKIVQRGCLWRTSSETARPGWRPRLSGIEDLPKTRKNKWFPKKFQF